MMSSWRDHRGHLLLDVGPISEADGQLVEELLVALGRAANGDAAAALVAWARQRAGRGRRAGVARLSFHEAGGPPDARPGRWVAETDLAERKRAG